MDRRNILMSGAIAAMSTATSGGLARASREQPRARTATPFIETNDGTKLFYREWGKGRPILFNAAWAFHSAAWQYQMAALANQGFRCIAFDRRGHGRSSDPGAGYDMDTLADDVACVIEHLDIAKITLIGHSMGGAEAVRYLTRHGSGRVAQLLLVAPTTPYIRRTNDNPDGIDPAFSETARAAFARDFPGVAAANMKTFVVPTTTQALIDWIVQMMTQTSLRAVLECHRAFSETDFRSELPRLSLPTLILQGDADMSAPLALTGKKTAQLIPNAQLRIYQDAPHGLIFTHSGQINGDMAAFAAQS